MNAEQLAERRDALAGLASIRQLSPRTRRLVRRPRKSAASVRVRVATRTVSAPPMASGIYRTCFGTDSERPTYFRRTTTITQHKSDGEVTSTTPPSSFTSQRRGRVGKCATCESGRVSTADFSKVCGPEICSGGCCLLLVPQPHSPQPHPHMTTHDVVIG